MTKQGRTHNTPKEFLQKYKSLVDPAVKKRWEAAEQHSQEELLQLSGSCCQKAALLVQHSLTRDRGIWLAL